MKDGDAFTRIGAQWRRLGDLLLTADPRQRVRLLQSGTALALMAAGTVGMHYFAHVGFASTRAVWLWTVLALAGPIGFYALIRSGWSRRCTDPSLTLPQMFYALPIGAAAYALLGQARGAVFPITMLILAFGMFRLSRREMTFVALGGVALFGVTMAQMATRQPEVYVPAVEFGHFLMIVVTMPALSLLAGRLTRLREHNRSHRQQLATALERIQELATRDELTGLVNRRHMNTLLEQERQRCVRSGRGYSMAVVDIDHFKGINDHYGHAVGDEVLRNFARQAPQALRSTDVVSRWGGEEFVLLLPEATLSSARIGVERLRGRIAATPMAHLSGVPIRVTVSVGLTEHIAGEAVVQALERADRALYEAKAQGRNRTVVA